MSLWDLIWCGVMCLMFIKVSFFMLWLVVVIRFIMIGVCKILFFFVIGWWLRILFKSIMFFFCLNCSWSWSVIIWSVMWCGFFRDCLVWWICKFLWLICMMIMILLMVLVCIFIILWIFLYFLGLVMLFLSIICCFSIRVFLLKLKGMNLVGFWVWSLGFILMSLVVVCLCFWVLRLFC